MMARLVEQTIQSKQYPYRTRGDLLRHALHRHMQWLGEMGDLPMLGQVNSMVDILRDEEFNDDFSRIFSKLDERIKCHVERGDRSEATRLILLMTNHIKQMPDGFWRNKYQREIQAKYGEFLKGSYSAKLGEMDDD